MSKVDRTRLHILTATWELLDRADVEPATMAEIARAAGVSRQLLYFHFANRTALFLEVERHVEARVRSRRRANAVTGAGTAAQALRAFVEMEGAVAARIAGVIAALDVLIGDAMARSGRSDREDTRLTRCKALADRVAGDGVLRPEWTVAAAADAVWSATSVASWRSLVRERGWSSRAWVARTTLTLERTLLLDPSARND